MLSTPNTALLHDDVLEAPTTAGLVCGEIAGGDTLDTGVVSVNGETGVVTVIEGALEEAITAKGVSFGSITDGTELPKGMTFTDFVRKMFVKQIPPTYSQPTVAFTSPTNQTKEAGEVLNLSVAARFTKNDAGALTDLKITRSVGGATAETIVSGTTQLYGLQAFDAH